MSVKSVYRQKSAFRVMYAYRVSGEPVWRDYYGRSLSYMEACEKIEALKVQYRGHAFKVLHEKLLPKRAA